MPMSAGTCVCSSQRAHTCWTRVGRSTNTIPTACTRQRPCVAPWQTLCWAAACTANVCSIAGTSVRATYCLSWPTSRVVREVWDCCTACTHRSTALPRRMPTLTAVFTIKVAILTTKTKISGPRALQKIPHFGLGAKKLCDTYPQSPLQVPDGYIDTRHRPNPSNSLPTRCFTRVWA